MVYLFADADNKYMKIGFSAKTPEARLKAVRTETKLDLRIMYVVLGSLGTEKYMHKRFSKYHIKREWFKYNDEIAKYFDSVYNDDENIKARSNSTGDLFIDHQNNFLKYLSVNMYGDTFIMPKIMKDACFYLGVNEIYLMKIISALEKKGVIKSIGHNVFKLS